MRQILGHLSNDLMDLPGVLLNADGLLCIKVRNYGFAQHDLRQNVAQTVGGLLGVCGKRHPGKLAIYVFLKTARFSAAALYYLHTCPRFANFFSDFYRRQGVKKESVATFGANFCKKPWNADLHGCSKTRLV